MTEIVSVSNIALQACLLLVIFPYVGSGFLSFGLETVPYALVWIVFSAIVSTNYRSKLRRSLLAVSAVSSFFLIIFFSFWLFSDVSMSRFLAVSAKLFAVPFYIFLGPVLLRAIDSQSNPYPPRLNILWSIMAFLSICDALNPSILDQLLQIERSSGVSGKLLASEPSTFALSVPLLILLSLISKRYLPIISIIFISQSIRPSGTLVFAAAFSILLLTLYKTIIHIFRNLHRLKIDILYFAYILMSLVLFQIFVSYLRMKGVLIEIQQTFRGFFSIAESALIFSQANNFRLSQLLDPFLDSSLSPKFSKLSIINDSMLIDPSTYVPTVRHFLGPVLFIIYISILLFSVMQSPLFKHSHIGPCAETLVSNKSLLSIVTICFLMSLYYLVFFGVASHPAPWLSLGFSTYILKLHRRNHLYHDSYKQ